MAARELLVLFREARSGCAQAQLKLAKGYLDGKFGLPMSAKTAWHWLRRAACGDCGDACVLIGQYIPYDIATQEGNISEIFNWYHTALNAGVNQAGLVLAKLMLAGGTQDFNEITYNNVCDALCASSRAGNREAQHLLSGTLAKWFECNKTLARQWTTRAALDGLPTARYLLAEHWWNLNECDHFLKWALPLARSIAGPVPKSLQESEERMTVACDLSDQQITLISRCAQVLSQMTDANQREVQYYWLLAAQGYDRDAQLQIGIWFANIGFDGKSKLEDWNLPDYKRATHWLTLAAKQGSGAAWYTMSRIYRQEDSPEHSLCGARQCLRQAAEHGHRQAQYECGAEAWRSPHALARDWLVAAYWLQKAAAQGCAKSKVLLRGIARTAKPAAWAQKASLELSIGFCNRHPFFAARIELAATFGLSPTETLLIDLGKSDKGFCLDVDLQGTRRDHKRRLILVENSEQREKLIRIAKIRPEFDPNDPDVLNHFRNCLRMLFKVGIPETENKSTREVFRQIECRRDSQNYEQKSSY